MENNAETNKRYLFSYTLTSSDKPRQFSIVEKNEKLARDKAQERIADLEFAEPEEVIVGDVLRVIDAEKTYYECEGCT